LDGPLSVAYQVDIVEASDIYRSISVNEESGTILIESSVKNGLRSVFFGQMLCSTLTVFFSARSTITQIGEPIATHVIQVVVLKTRMLQCFVEMP